MFIFIIKNLIYFNPFILLLQAVTRNSNNQINLSVSLLTKKKLLPHDKVTTSELSVPTGCFALKSPTFLAAKNSQLYSVYLYVHNLKSVLAFFRLDEHHGIINNML